MGLFWTFLTILESCLNVWAKDKIFQFHHEFFKKGHPALTNALVTEGHMFEGFILIDPFAAIIWQVLIL